MKKTFLKIFIATLIFLIGISAVNAIEENSTDIVTFEENDEIQLYSDDALSVDEGDVIATSGDEVIGVSSDDVLSSEVNEKEIISLSNDVEKVSAFKNNSNPILSSSMPPSDVPIGFPTITHSSNLKLEKTYNLGDMITKEFVFAKVKITKKDYKRFVLKTPSKKNKKLWKQYKKFNKVSQKKLKKYMKNKIKSIKNKNWNIDWYYGIRPIFVIKGKYCTIYGVCMCYKYI